MAQITSTNIAARALDEMGETRSLASLDDETDTRARILRRHFDGARRSVLEAYPWNFASARVQLSASADRPIYPSDAYDYKLPSDCLKVREVQDLQPGEVWTIEVRGDTSSSLERVLTINREGPLKLTYTKDIDNYSIWSPMAIDVLVNMLAAMACMGITQSRSVQSDLYSKYEARLSGARRSDAQASSPPMSQDGQWVKARW